MTHPGLNNSERPLLAWLAGQPGVFSVYVTWSLYHIWVFLTIKGNEATPEVQIGELPLQPGASLEFVYDFGDWWRFQVTLEKIDPPDPKIKKSRLIEKHGQAPKQYGW